MVNVSIEGDSKLSAKYDSSVDELFKTDFRTYYTTLQHVAYISTAIVSSVFFVT